MHTVTITIINAGKGGGGAGARVMMNGGIPDCKLLMFDL